MMTYKELSLFIHQNPELGFQEFEAVKIQQKFLEERGFKVNFPYGNIPTAFRAEYGDDDAPCVVFMSEYDALQGMGHACGHNLIAAAAMKAFEETASFLKNNNVKGKAVLLGTPAEESYGGKISLIKEHAFDDADIALISHPMDVSGIGEKSMGAAHLQVEFFGRSAHASGAPDEGINALDAMITFFSSIALYRQQMPKTAQIHGIITDGGSAPNIIPDYTKALFYTRSYDLEDHKKVNADFKRIVEGAALSANCSCKLSDFAPLYETSTTYPAMEKVLMQEMEKAGLDGKKIPLRITSDLGNVSNVIPTTNICFEITKNKKTPGHSIEFRDAAATDYAVEQALKAGSAMAQTAIRFYTDETFRKEAPVAEK